MSTLKRWQTPASLSLVLAAAIILVLAVGYRADTQSRAPADLASTTATPAQCPSPLAAPASPAPVTPSVAPTAPSTGPVAPRTNGSGDNIQSVVGSHNHAQNNDGGFGDIGMQFQNVNLLAPITNIHVSGNNNATNVNVAADNTVSVSIPIGVSAGSSTSSTPSGSSAPSDPAPSGSSTPPADPGTASTPSTPGGTTTPTTPADPSSSSTPSSGAPAGSATTPSPTTTPSAP